jgi:hypothetical protein
MRAGGALALALVGGEQRTVLSVVGPLLEHADADVRARALAVVVVLGPDAGLLVARVHAMLEDPDEAVRSEAQRAVRALRGPTVADEAVESRTGPVPAGPVR